MLSYNDRNFISNFFAEVTEVIEPAGYLLDFSTPSYEHWIINNDFNRNIVNNLISNLDRGVSKGKTTRGFIMLAPSNDVSIFSIKLLEYYINNEKDHNYEILKNSSNPTKIKRDFSKLKQLLYNGKSLSYNDFSKLYKESSLSFYVKSEIHQLLEQFKNINRSNSYDKINEFRSLTLNVNRVVWSVCDNILEKNHVKIASTKPKEWAQVKNLLNKKVTGTASKNLNQVKDGNNEICNGFKDVLLGINHIRNAYKGAHDVNGKDIIPYKAEVLLSLDSAATISLFLIRKLD